MGSGWIKLFREIREHWLWPGNQFPPQRYSRVDAFIDLIMSANFTAGKTEIGGSLIAVERGQFVTSQKKLAARWGWDRETTSVFLRHLESDMTLHIKTSRGTGTGYTLITIANYGKYQDRQEATSTGSGTATSLGTSTEADIIEEVKKKNKTPDSPKAHPVQFPLPPRKRKHTAPSRAQSVAFDAWYSSYPLHKDRVPALKAWLKISPDEALTAAITKQTEAYSLEVEGREPKYIKQPATWLNARPWEDEPAGGAGNGKSHQVKDLGNGFFEVDGRQMERAVYESRYGTRAN